MKKKVMIIGGSTRPGRMGKPLIKWLESSLADSNTDLEFTVVDLEELDLPFLDEPNPPMQGNYQKPHTLAWAKQVGDADGFIIVTPEYNAGYPAPLKNAMGFGVPNVLLSAHGSQGGASHDSSTIPPASFFS